MMVACQNILNVVENWKFTNCILKIPLLRYFSYLVATGIKEVSPWMFVYLTAAKKYLLGFIKYLPAHNFKGLFNRSLLDTCGWQQILECELCSYGGGSRLLTPLMLMMVNWTMNKILESLMSLLVHRIPAGLGLNFIHGYVVTCRV